MTQQTKVTNMKKEHINYKKRCLIAQYMREMQVDRMNMFAFLWKNYDSKDVDAFYNENLDLSKLV